MKTKKIVLAGGLVAATALFSFQSRFFEIAKQIEIYNNLYKTLNINYIDEINPGELTDKAIKNTLKNLDPYTNFYNEQDVETARIRREGEYGGIGVANFYTQKGIVIAEVYKDLPADKAGLKAGDVIVDVNGQSLLDLERSQLSEMLKGTPGKQLDLRVKRQGKSLNFSLALDKIIVNPVPFYEMINAETGYIVLTRFTAATTTTEVTKAFNALKEKGMKKLVFDLRSNPGGSLSDAINVVNLFIERGKKVVETKGKTNNNSRVYLSKRDPLDLEIPIVVLIDDRSASASEIVSGALQDYDRAVVMGQRSFGKGLVQRYFKLTYGTQMKATISKYYTPSGRCIQELDYANRDQKTGKVPKFSDGEVTAFKTANGRTVYDGGGVTPDIIVKSSKKTAATKRLLRSRAVFGFAVDYLAKHPNLDATSFVFKPTDFNDFKSFLIATDTTFTTKQEFLFKKAYKEEKNNKEIVSEYKNLLNKVQQTKVAKVSENKDVLSLKLQDEIVKLASYKKGMYEHKLKYDATIKDAVTLLNNPTKYTKILEK